MKKHFTNNEITILAQNLNHPGLATYTGSKFHYALAKNRRLIGNDVEDITKGLRITKEMETFMDNLVIDSEPLPSSEVKDEPKKDLKPKRKWHECETKELSEIIEKNKSNEGVDKELSQAIIDKFKSNQDLLDSIVEIELYKIEQDILPDNINGNHFRMLEPFIMEDDPRAPKKAEGETKDEDNKKE